MDDLISRQTAIDAVLSIGHIAKLTDGDAVIRMSAVNYVLRNLPSAEPEEDTIEMQEADIDEAMKLVRDARVTILPSVEPERKIGHWVEIGDEPYDEWECDMCGFVIDGSGCIDPLEYLNIYKFCPNCGANMKGGEDE